MTKNKVEFMALTPVESIRPYAESPPRLKIEIQYFRFFSNLLILAILASIEIIACLSCSDFVLEELLFLE